MTAHSADAVAQNFFASLKSWRERRKTDEVIFPPRRRKDSVEVFSYQGQRQQAALV
jgi:hypothetical protein